MNAIRSCQADANSNPFIFTIRVHFDTLYMQRIPPVPLRRSRQSHQFPAPTPVSKLQPVQAEIDSLEQSKALPKIIVE